MREALLNFTAHTQPVRSRFLLNLLAGDAAALVRLDGRYHVGDPLAAGGYSREKLRGLGVVGLYTQAPSNPPRQTDLDSQTPVTATVAAPGQRFDRPQGVDQ